MSATPPSFLDKTKAEESVIAGWFKAHWPHIPTWIGLGIAFFKHWL